MIYSLIVSIKFTVTQCLEGRRASYCCPHAGVYWLLHTQIKETNLNRNVSKHACSRDGSQQRCYFFEMKMRLYQQNSLSVRPLLL